MRHNWTVVVGYPDFDDGAIEEILECFRDTLVEEVTADESEGAFDRAGRWVFDQLGSRKCVIHLSCIRCLKRYPEIEPGQECASR